MPNSYLIMVIIIIIITIILLPFLLIMIMTFLVQLNNLIYLNKIFKLSIPNKLRKIIIKLIITIKVSFSFKIVSNLLFLKEINLWDIHLQIILIIQAQIIVFKIHKEIFKLWNNVKAFKIWKISKILILRDKNRFKELTKVWFIINLIMRIFRILNCCKKAFKDSKQKEFLFSKCMVIITGSLLKKKCLILRNKIKIL